MERDEDVSDYKEIVREFSKGAIVWYEFRKNSDILYVYNDKVDESVVEFLESKGSVDKYLLCALCGRGEYAAVGKSDDNLSVNNESEYNISNVNDNVNESEETHLYDYIVGIDIIEQCEDYQQLLNIFYSHLKTDGRLIIGAENRYAIKYFCGDRDPYTNHSFDGIENYRRLMAADKGYIKGRCYSQVELDKILCDAGFKSRFYSVMPSLQETQLVYADDYTPVEELSMRYFPLYNHPESVFMDEQYLYTDLIKNGLFHKMANAYIIECEKSSAVDKHNNIVHATISMDRGMNNAMVTVISECNKSDNDIQENKSNYSLNEELNNKSNNNRAKTVYKKAIYPEGLGKLEIIRDNQFELQRHGINVVDSHIEGDKLVMPYIDKPIAMLKLKDIAKRDKAAYLRAMDIMYELIINSSEHTDIISDKDRNSANGRDMGVILAKGYIDMVPLNCFYDEEVENEKDRFIFYDQEFYWENCPANVIMYRSITIIYDGTDKQFESIVPRREIMERYNLLECEDIWTRMSSRFTTVLRNQEILVPYYNEKRTNPVTVYTNREKVNYSDREYNYIFNDIFAGLDKPAPEGKTKKLVIFGSGTYTKRFLAQFSGEYDIYSIIDNNKSLWGTKIDGISVNPPDIVRDIDKSELHIIICIKKYYGVVNQLRQLGVEEYHIYDPGRDYPNKKRQNIINKLNRLSGQRANSDCDREDDMDDINAAEKNYQNEYAQDNARVGQKPYNIGYIAGVFDLFHIGHLNMFRRAKEMCNYLIVGVVSDEGVRLNKQAEPFVPFEERIEMVRSCRYVDEAVKLPLDFAGTRDMFKVYHFDVQFSGSDYENNPYWLEEKKFLEENGATMVFFPYTKSTSSTKLKKAIESRIDNN